MFDCECIWTTANIIVIKGNKSYFFNFEDSKAYILFNKYFKQIINAHKIIVDEEKARVESKGGIIRKDRIIGQLILATTFGYLNAKQYGVIEKNIEKFCEDIVKLVLNKNNKENICCMLFF